jgi:hypothetical protein
MLNSFTDELDPVLPGGQNVILVEEYLSDATLTFQAFVQTELQPQSGKV